jgi:Arc/MetJ-type ribon-helix-helix transcriptional regulator
MTIHLPENLESSIREAVCSGLFASVDDAMAEAARLLLRQLDQRQAAPATSVVSQASTEATTNKPIWEEILELTADIPDEEWDKLPVDGAEQHDHHIYGTPKRPAAQ